MLAYDYPILGAFWTIFLVFIWVLWIFLLFRIVIDIFRSHDLGGVAKALWLILIIFLPYLGVFVYVIARGHGMSRRDLEQAQARDEAFRSYVQQTAGGGGGTADALAKLADLRERGVLSDAEFEREKAKILA